MSIKAVFFDIDGTLVDSNEFHVMAWGQAFHDFGVHVPHDAIRRHIGKGADMLIPALLPGATEQQQKWIAARHDDSFRSSYLPQVRPFAGAAELVASVHGAGVKAVLASSANTGDVDHYIELLGIRPFLNGSTSADDVSHSKPAADLFASALQKVAPTSAAEALVVGDTPYDVIAANGCAIRCVALLSGGFSEADLDDAGAAAIYTSVAALLDIPLQDWITHVAAGPQAQLHGIQANHQGSL